MKKTISFVNPNFQQGPKALNAYYLPYSAAILWAYAKTSEQVDKQFDLNTFIWRRDNIQDTVEKLKNDSVVGFSTYLWNNSYNNVLARELKKVNPDVLIVFGGPQPPIEDYDFFERFPYVDICVKTEGEVTFQSILESYDTKEFSDIPGILINRNGKTIDTGNAVRIKDVDIIPSPYLTGLFDNLLVEFPEVSWTATLETNRGCPYACTFCDWGSLTYAKVKKFKLERVYAELEWIGKNQLDFVSITDANFGIFPERDLAIADKLVQVQKEYDNPKSYTISWAKNQKAEVIEIVKKLMIEGGSTLGLNLSVQTLDERTLEIIKRKNLAMNKVEEVFDACEVNNIPLYTELILGLPGETPESWRKNFYGLYEAGNHTGITVYQAQLLENAEMNLTQRNLYNIKGSMVYDYLVGSYNTHELQEGVEVVNSTLDLPVHEMLNAQLFSWFQITFHINGLTNYLARFLKRYAGESYEDFYEKLYEFIKKDEWLLSEIDRISKFYTNWLTKGAINHPPISGMEIHGWNLIHSTTIRLHSESMTGHVSDYIAKFINTEYSEIDPDIRKELLSFQRNFVVDFARVNEYPIREEYEYDILGYIQDSGDLNVKTKFEFNFPEDKTMSLETFCEKIFFDRRKNFGKAWITKL